MSVFLYCFSLLLVLIFTVQKGYGNAGTQPEQFAASQSLFSNVFFGVFIVLMVAIGKGLNTSVFCQ